MEDPARNRLRTMLGELLDHLEGAQEVASGIAQEYPEYEAMPKRYVARPIWWRWRANWKPTVNTKATISGRLRLENER
jgi:hypothetical protein